MPQFTHLHVHTQYSILDGAASIKSLAKEAKKFGMTALAITDHGNMYGVKQFHNEMRAAGIKPILGCEVYIVSDRHSRVPEKGKRHHLILLAKNAKGYSNLIELVSLGFTEGFYTRPRIDHSILEKYHEGIICCSACLGGEIPQAIMRGDISEAERIIEWYKRVFGDDYYLELQLHKPHTPEQQDENYHDQMKVNPVIADLAERLSVKLVATNDVHFTHREDATAHDHLICLNTGKSLSDPNRMRYSGEEYFKSPDEMAELFPEYPQAIENTCEIADKVEEYELDRGPLMPNFDPPEDFVIDPKELRETVLRKIKDEELAEKVRTTDSLDSLAAEIPEFAKQLTIARQFIYLKALTYKGAAERYGDPLEDSIRERFEYELRTIENMGFPGYFLIVWDYIRAAREMGVSVGPGRGSAAGSAVAYALRITNIDPIKYDLLFERFLNPDRISLPDVDVDFDEDGREDVLKYVVSKYGQKRVTQIITFGQMAPKMAIRDVARIQGLDLPTSDRLAKMVPDKISPEKHQTQFEKLFQDVPELKDEMENSPNPLIRDTLKYAEQLEGSIRQTGVHACGVIIGQDDIDKFAPVAIAKDTDLNVVQFEGQFVESVGLIKMDFLGLKTLSIIKDAVANVKRTRNLDLDIDAIPLDDSLTFELFCNGETTGIFQFESAGMKKYLRGLKPSRLEDLIAMNALYRPGPMDKIPSFIDRKHGKEPVTYEIPEMEKYLKTTYGITVYQEQVMLLSQLLAGFTGGEADTLRKAMGKKKRDVLDKMKPKFLDGALQRGHDPKICEDIWGQWEAFASYAFNKSHSTCYAYVAYQTAYLKAHYPAEFMAALMSRNKSSIEKVTNFMEESKRMGLKVMGPDINESMHTFSADSEGNVRFGMAAIKGVGEAAVLSIIRERESGGRFTDIYDFMERVDFQSVNRKVMENMALGGCFDSILGGMHRSLLLSGDDSDTGTGTFLDQLIRYGSSCKQERSSAQQSLFGDDEITTAMRPMTPKAEPWSDIETLEKEKEVLGMYLSSHPLDAFAPVMKHMCNTSMAQLDNLLRLKGREFMCGGIVSDARHLVTKTGKPFGKMTVEDYSGFHEFVFFDNDYINFRKFMNAGYSIALKGKVQPRKYRENEMEAKVTSIMTLDQVQQEMIRELVVDIPLEDISDTLTEEIENILDGNKGSVLVRIRVIDQYSGVMTAFALRQRISLTSSTTDFLEHRNIDYHIS